MRAMRHLLRVSSEWRYLPQAQLGLEELHYLAGQHTVRPWTCLPHRLGRAHLLIVRRGCLRLLVDDQPLQVRGSQAAFLPRGCHLAPDPPAGTGRFWWIALAEARLEAVFPPRPQAWPCGRGAIDAAERLFDHAVAGRGALRLRADLHLLIAEVAEAAARQPPVDRRLDACIEAIDRDPAQAPDVPALVLRSGLSRTTFHRAFRERTGHAPAEYIARRRIDLALRHLARRPRPGVAALAAACGFASVVSFRRRFRAYTGRTPTAGA